MQWRLALASAIGTSHSRSGMPCQDAAAYALVADSTGREVLIAATADGAGSAKKSDIGSRLACSRLVEHLAQWLQTNEATKLYADTFTEWVNWYRSEIALMADSDGVKPREYASTLLSAVIADDFGLFFQIGDGAIVFSASETPGHFECVFWPQNGEYANTTNFVTDPAAADNFYFDRFDGQVAELAMFTDGIQSLVLNYANQAAHAPFFEKMLSVVRAEPSAGHSGTLSQGLERYLSSQEVNSKTDDDKTLLLATRRCTAAC